MAEKKFKVTSTMMERRADGTEVPVDVERDPSTGNPYNFVGKIPTPNFIAPISAPPSSSGCSDFTPKSSDDSSDHWSGH